MVAAAALLTQVSTLGDLASGIGSLFGGETATDRERAARAQNLLRVALGGDPAALRQLEFDAFEPRTGAAGDNRRPVDNKLSPAAVRDLSRKALVSYYQQTGLPAPARYAAQLGLPIRSAGEQLIQTQIVQPVLQAVGGAAVDVAQQRAVDKARDTVPYVIAAAVLVGALVLLLKVK